MELYLHYLQAFHLSSELHGSSPPARLHLATLPDLHPLHALFPRRLVIGLTKGGEAGCCAVQNTEDADGTRDESIAAGILIVYPPSSSAYTRLSKKRHPRTAAHGAARYPTNIFVAWQGGGKAEVGRPGPRDGDGARKKKMGGKALLIKKQNADENRTPAQGVAERRSSSSALLSNIHY